MLLIPKFVIYIDKPGDRSFNYMKLKISLFITYLFWFTAFSMNGAAQTNELQKKVDEAVADVRQKRFEKISELRKLEDSIYPYLAKYYRDPDETVRKEVVALVSGQKKQGALDVLGNFLTDSENYISSAALASIHAEYACLQIKSSKSIKPGLLEYLSKTTNSAKAVLLLSCFADNSEIRRLIEEKRKDKGIHGDGGIHYGVPFNLSVEMALAEMGDPAAVGKVKVYIKEADVKNLFFILDNIKFVNNKEIRQNLVELLNDKRPVYEPISHTNFYLRVCDLALTALTLTDSGIMTANFEKQRAYTDEELKSAYQKLKTVVEKTDQDIKRN
jgi:hypothetical protein